MPPSKTRKKTTRKSGQAEQIPAQDPNSRYAPTVWGTQGLGLQELPVPSGQLCLVRRSGVLDLMRIGVLDSVDTLSALVDEKHLKRVQGKPAELNVETFLQDEEAIKKTMYTVDRVVSTCVVQPQVFMTPNDVTNRKPGVVYCDMIDVLDRLYIYNYVTNGVKDLEPFRGGSDPDVAGVEAVADVPDEAE